MKCLCIQATQVRIDKKIHTVRRGDIKELDKLPDNGCWASLDSDADTPHVVDFSKAEKPELLESDTWSFSEAKAFVKTNYKVNLKEGDKKNVVDQIIDARYRSLNPTLPGTTGD